MNRLDALTRNIRAQRLVGQGSRLERDDGCAEPFCPEREHPDVCADVYDSPARFRRHAGPAVFAAADLVDHDPSRRLVGSAEPHAGKTRMWPNPSEIEGLPDKAQPVAPPSERSA